MDDVAFSRELLQAKLLIEIMSHALNNELVLKGGLAMRAVMGSKRFTKDIDLDAVTKASGTRIQGIVRRSIESVIRQPGLIDDAILTSPKQTETTLRWKLNGKAAGTNRPLTLTVEVSRREWAAPFKTQEVELDSRFAQGAASGRIVTLDAQALAVCKILAMTDPKREAPRDLYDLSILLQLVLEDTPMLLASQDRRRLELALDELWVKVEKMGYDRFKSDVAPYLPEAVANAVTEEVYGEMQIKVATTVEQWLERAIELQDNEERDLLIEKPEAP